MFSHSDYKVTFWLQTDINKAVEANNVWQLKTLLQHESLNFGVIDDAAARMYMGALRTMRNTHPGATFTLSEIVTAVESKKLIT